MIQNNLRLVMIKMMYYITQIITWRRFRPAPKKTQTNDFNLETQKVGEKFDNVITNRHFRSSKG